MSFASLRSPALLLGLATLALFGALTPVSAAAQPRLRWGSVPDEHRDATAGTDSNATAIVLADVGRTYFSDNGKVVFEHHRRVKILSPNAFERWGTVSVFAGEGERIEDLRAQTLVPTDGRYRGTGVRRGDIFSEEVGQGVRRQRFTFPALEPGAIVEHSYRLVSDYIFAVPAWDFQTDEPTLWSEYRFDMLTQFAYVFSLNGILAQELALNTQERGVSNAGDALILRWAARDMPALRPEPMMTTLDDFRAGISFQLSGVNTPGFGRESVLNTWQSVTDRLVGSTGVYKNAMSDVRERTAAVLGATQATTPEEKIEALYQFAQSAAQVESGGGISPTRNALQVLRERKGTSVEINLLLVALLRGAGLDAHPALLSTRDHGRMRSDYPLLSQFNELVAFVREGERTYTLDASNPLRPSTLLPARHVNGEVWVARAPAGEWVPVRAPAARHIVSARATLSPEFEVRGRAEYSSTGYSALADREGLRDTADEATFIRESIFEAPSDVALDSVVVHERTVPTSALRAEAAFSRTGVVQEIGGMLYLYPMFFQQQTENPFVSPTRRLPVDLVYPRDVTYTLHLTLPDGLELAERPVARRLSLPSGGSYVQSVSLSGTALVVTTRFQLTSTLYPATLYAPLREMWDAVVAAQAEPVVLRRRADAPTAPGSGG